MEFPTLKDSQSLSRLQYTLSVFDTDPLAPLELFQIDLTVTIYGEVFNRL